jgi:abortive infection bacteriophage resistance protein
MRTLVAFLFYKDCFMKKPFRKPFLPVPDQINLLKQRGLLFSDEALAAQTLSTNCYYRMSGYFYTFLVPDLRKEHQFLPGIDFQDIFALYRYDASLRGILLRQLAQIEITFKTVFCLEICNHWGPHWYLDSKHFGKRFGQSSSPEYEFEGFINEVKRLDEEFIRHYRETYDNPPHPPFWMLIEVLSFGKISKLFAHLRKEEISIVAKPFGIKPRDLISWIQGFANLRNHCAHHSRIWNKTFASTFKNPKRYLREFDGYFEEPGNKLFSRLISIVYLSERFNHGNEWINELDRLLKQLRKSIGHEFILTQAENYLNIPKLRRFLNEVTA